MNILFEKFALAFIVFFLSGQIAAQSLDWVHIPESSVGVFYTSMDVGADETVALCGYFTGTVNLSPGAAGGEFTSNGDRDLFVQKVSADGTVIWSRRIGGIADDRASDIAMDAAGNVYVTGYFSEEVDFDPLMGESTLTAGLLSRAFVLKLSNTGSLGYAIALEGTGYSRGYAVDATDQGVAVVAGVFTNDVDFNPDNQSETFSSNGFEDGFILQLTADGELDFAQTFGGSGFDAVNDVCFVPFTNQIAACGSFRETVLFPNDKSGVELVAEDGEDDGVVLHLSAFGDLNWIIAFHGEGADACRALAVHPNGMITAGLSFSNTLDVNPGSEELNISAISDYSGVLVHLLGADGAYLWHTTIMGNGPVFIQSVVAHNSGIIAGGVFNGTIEVTAPDGAASLDSNGSGDLFVAQLSASGLLNQVFSEGGFGNDECKGVHYIDESNFYVAGTFNQSMDMDPGPDEQSVSPVGGVGSFLQRLVVCPQASIVQEGTSLIASPQTGTSSFSWYDCNTDEFLGTGVMYEPLSNGLYYVLVVDGACSDFSDCFNVTNVGVREQSAAGLRVFPNPANGWFVIQAGREMLGTDAFVVDAQGKLVSRFVVSDQPVSTSQWPSGVYSVRLKSGGFRLVVE